MNIFEKRRIQEQVERDLREASSQRSRDRRVERDLKKAQSTGNVSYFLKKQSDSNEILRSALATVDPSFQQPSVEYQKSLTTTATQRTLDQKLQQIQPSPETILPPRPNDDLIYSLTVEDTELRWLPYGGGSSSPHPWQILLRTNDETYEYKIEVNSRLYSGLESWSDIEVGGLDGWANASVGYVILFGVVDDGVCTEANIQSGQGSLPTRITFSEDIQTGFAVQLGYLFEQDNVFFVRQNAFHNFTLINVCVSGKPAIYPMAI
jgi:hypothetical protein